MLRTSRPDLRVVRHYNNLANKGGEGRVMTGHMTPYRHWSWKQNEVWRQVHEAQFEHVRKVYRRQWFEAFRANADEYIYKYNITKAAQILSWEREMEDQEEKRVAAVEMASGRAALKQKHMDILQEYHERHFFHWYERASERLQYMSKLKWIDRDSIDEHIEKELNKYLDGKEDPYELNFVGQMPMIEDADGIVVRVPESMLSMHQAEMGDKMPAQAYEVPRGTGDAEAYLREVIGGGEQDLDDLSKEEVIAVEDIIEADEIRRASKIKLAKSEEQTLDEQRIEGEKYKMRGKVGTVAGSKVGLAKGAQEIALGDDDDEQPGSAGAAAAEKKPKKTKKGKKGPAPESGRRRVTVDEIQKSGRIAHEDVKFKVGEKVTQTPKIEFGRTNKMQQVFDAALKHSGADGGGSFKQKRPEGKDTGKDE